MVKPLNKEWELFGAKYRVAGAKGDKVDCNACRKQVSAAVNRLQSHMRVCPARLARPSEGVARKQQQLNQQQLNQQQLNQQQLQQQHGAFSVNSARAMAELSHSEAMGGAPALAGDVLSESEIALSAANHAFLSPGTAAASSAAAPAHEAVPPGLLTSATHTENTTHPTPAGDTAAVVSFGSLGAPPPKRQRTASPRPRERPRWTNASAVTAVEDDDFWLVGTTPQPSPASAPAASSSPSLLSSAAYAKRHLELEEKRLMLEIKKDQRDERRELFRLEILEAQARRERLAAEKDAYAARVQLALSRKQLRDQGVDEAEIDRVLPTDTRSSSATAATRSYEGSTPATGSGC